MTTSFGTGFLLSASLIVAIGAQNAFVLRQGVRREHVLAVVLTCAFSDAILMSAGILGFGALSNASPWLKPVMTYGGALFLLVYGALAFWSAFTGKGALKAENGESTGLWKTVAICLALTWGNPHVYLDTIVVLGSVAAGHDDSHLGFALGAISASFLFFFSLGYGARLLAPVFASPRAWRVLDVIVGILMWTIAVALILEA
ncbi:MAG: LysE/ArgO family amino acid transporter [Silicimonas sp.]|nr:LysE/ArgO family amino acid transporter [Silicimonas sp.]